MPRASIWIRNKNWEKWQASSKGKMVNELLAADIGTTIGEPVIINSSSRSAPKRSQADVLKDIHALEAEVERADMTNQDPDYWAEINDKKARIQELWAEWRAL